MSSPFSPPATASGITWKNYLNRLILIEPESVEQGIQTVNGEKEAVRATVTVIDGPDEPEVYSDALIFPGVLISQTRSLIGQKVLGRLTQGQAKSGQNPPWMLTEATADDIKIGTSYLNSRKSGKASNPFASAGDPPF